MIELRPLSLQDMQTVRKWRDTARETLRTPYMLTEEMQEQYYRDVICNRDSRTRYWGLVTDDIPFSGLVSYIGDKPPTPITFIGYGGLENISWENGNAEISLLIGPEYQRKGYGRQAVVLFLREAFERMRLYSVYGECYECGPWEFWAKLNGEDMDSLHESDMYGTFLPGRKFWNGRHWESYYFTFYRSHYERLSGNAVQESETGA